MVITDRSYLLLILGLAVWAFAALFVWGAAGRDHFAAIARDGDRAWYQNYSSLTRREIQDKDIYYHNIGNTISQARNADIILLGNSVLLFGLRDEMLEEFRLRHGLRIFNMALAGVPSGQFVRRVIERWKIRPKLWVISADDHGARFFSPDIHDYGNFTTSAGDVVNTTRLKGWLNVSARNLRWRIERLLISALPDSYVRTIFNRHPAPPTFRNIERGSVSYDQVASYTAPGHSLIKIVRDQNCHSDEQEVGIAKKYLKEIGQRTVFMLMPHGKYCPTRVRELAADVGVETIITPNLDYSTIDGVHLDRNGALAYTRFFLAELVETRAFQDVFGSAAGRQDASQSSGLDFDVCFTNTSAAGHFISLRYAESARDFALPAGQTLRERADASGELCQHDQPFGLGVCPNPTAQSWLSCSPDQRKHK